MQAHQHIRRFYWWPLSRSLLRELNARCPVADATPTLFSECCSTIVLPSSVILLVPPQLPVRPMGKLWLCL